MFPTASIKLSYAMTEACSSMTFTTIAAPSADRHEQQQQEDAEVAVPSAVSAVCVGMPAPGVEIAIQADEQLEAGEELQRMFSSDTVLEGGLVTAALAACTVMVSCDSSLRPYRSGHNFHARSACYAWLLA